MANIFSLLTVQKMQVAAITMTYCYVDGWVLSTVADYLRQEKDTSLVMKGERSKSVVPYYTASPATATTTLFLL